MAYPSFTVAKETHDVKRLPTTDLNKLKSTIKLIQFTYYFFFLGKHKNINKFNYNMKRLESLDFYLIVIHINILLMYFPASS